MVLSQGIPYSNPDLKIRIVHQNYRISHWERKPTWGKSQGISRKSLTSSFSTSITTGRDDRPRADGKLPLRTIASSSRRGGPCSVQARALTPTATDDTHSLTIFFLLDETPSLRPERLNDAQGEQSQRIQRFYNRSCSRYAEAEPGA
jgi:hypothetical protein